MKPQYMLLTLTVLFFSYLVISNLDIKLDIKLKKNKRPVKKVSRFKEIAVCFFLVFFLISFSAFTGPQFFQYINYTIENDTNTITNFEATSCVTSSVLTVVIGYMFVVLSQNKSPQSQPSTITEDQPPTITEDQPSTITEDQPPPETEERLT